MELYNPPNLALPALKIKKTRDRQAMESDPTVNNLIRSNLLLDVEFNKLYLHVLKKSQEIFKIIMFIKEQLLQEYSSFSKESVHCKKFKKEDSSLLTTLLWFEKFKLIPKDAKEEVDKVISEMTKGVKSDIRKTMAILSNKIQNCLSAFEQEKKVKLSILISTTIYFCKNCANIISLDKFERHTCVCGEKITKISQVKQIPIYHFNDRLINFLEKNYWFEHGVDYLLRRKNLQTLVGYYVLGHSGVWHEIDNIADSKSENFRFFCECKNSEVTVNDIFVFSGKMIDVGCTRGYIFTTSTRVSNEIVRLARSKNIDIVKGVLTRKTTALLKDIKEGQYRCGTSHNNG